MQNKPIGLLDSGLGGLSVLKKVREVLPSEQTVFIADQARLPYGDRPNFEIKTFTQQMVDFLLTKDVKAIVFACNTATAAAMAGIAPNLNVPVIGVIQSGALMATEQTHNGKIGVIGTNATINSHAYEREILLRRRDAEVFEVATPKLVPLIEGNESITCLNQTVIDSLQVLSTSEIDTLVLGCTHYPWIAAQIKANISPDIVLVDPADQVAKYTKKLLEQRNMLSDGQVVLHQYYTTGNVDKFTTKARELLGDQTITAKNVILD